MSAILTSRKNKQPFPYIFRNTPFSWSNLAAELGNTNISVLLTIWECIHPHIHDEQHFAFVVFLISSIQPFKKSDNCIKIIVLHKYMLFLTRPISALGTWIGNETNFGRKRKTKIKSFRNLVGIFYIVMSLIYQTGSWFNLYKYRKISKFVLFLFHVSFFALTLTPHIHTITPCVCWC